MNVIENYQKWIDKWEQMLEKLRKKDQFHSVLRFILFIGFILAVSFLFDKITIVTITIAGIVLIGFIIVLRKHFRIRDEVENLKNCIAIYKNEIACITKGKNEYYNGSAFIDPEHDFTSDMDVFGKNSLFALLNRSATGVGNASLAAILSGIRSKDEIIASQNAVQELADNRDWTFLVRKRLFRSRISDFSKQYFPSIKNTEKPKGGFKTSIIISQIILLATIIAIILTNGSGIILLIPVFFNAMINSRAGAFIQRTKLQLEGRKKIIDEYAFVIKKIEEEKWYASTIKGWQQKLMHENHSASDALNSLTQLTRQSEYSINMIVGAILNLFFLWDLIICLRIYKWFNRYADKTHDWFEVVGELEAHISLSKIVHNYPAWVFPEIIESDFFFESKQMGHPLIFHEKRVCNDFIMHKPTTTSIITGSNMAGKSTFLRTIGVNVILSHAGAPVCASFMKLSLFPVMTYLTITDSLSEGTSTFYREIKRLQKILERVREQPNTLLLLDEMLRGTNSADKAKGSIAISRELIQSAVPSVIATHNLELAELVSEFPDKVRNYYFDISVDQSGQMAFDYLLKEGVCNTFNASLLLKQIGINIDF